MTGPMSSASARLLFHSAGRIGIVRADGSECRALPLDVPGQTRWQAGPCLGPRAMLLFSHGKARTADLVRGAVLRRVWLYEPDSGALRELFAGRRPAPWIGISALLDGGRRAIVNAIVDGEQRLYTADLATERCEPLTEPGSGFHYGESLSPDGPRLACHVTGGKDGAHRALPHMPAPYSINVIDLATRRRTLIAGRPGHLYFGPVWSPDGETLAFLDCESGSDPAHFWADVCVADADGSSLRRVTEGQPHWFATSYGTAEARGGGSNSLAWVPAAVAEGRGRIAWTPKLPGSRPDVRYDASRPDHEEFVFAPEEARGGTCLQLLDPQSAEGTDLTEPEAGRWDFRVAFASDGRRFAFCRTRPGQAPTIWVGDRENGTANPVTAGFDGAGADFPVWLAADDEEEEA